MWNYVLRVSVDNFGMRDSNKNNKHVKPLNQILKL